jgi:D-beta-D-heptose 7-phosphate kinase/D-beta-D-heptose 1-phosphate adenosyltransferase
MESCPPEGITTFLPRPVTADVTGAGDTLAAVLAACLGSAWSIMEACRLANVATGIAVSHLGTYVVHASELDTAWNGLSPKILNWDATRRRVDA